jgi:hypothetical protein
MKTLGLVIATLFVLFGAAVSTTAAVNAGSTRVLNRISAETGVPIDTLQAQKAATGLSYGNLENANLLANASGQSFDTIVGKFKAGEGWGKIAQDYGLKLGQVVSAAHRSSHAGSHTQNVHSRKIHGKHTTNISRGHTSTMRSGGSLRSMGGGMGHGGHGGR